MKFAVAFLLVACVVACALADGELDLPEFNLKTSIFYTKQLLKLEINFLKNSR
jgi:hypothetical protein